MQLARSVKRKETLSGSDFSSSILILFYTNDKRRLHNKVEVYDGVSKKSKRIYISTSIGFI